MARALKEDWIPGALVQWVGVRRLEELAEQAELGWIPANLSVDALGQRCGRILIELTQPQGSAFIREVIRSPFLPKVHVRNGGLVMRHPCWKRFLRQADMPRRFQEVPLAATEGRYVQLRFSLRNARVYSSVV